MTRCAFKPKGLLSWSVVAEMWETEVAFWSVAFGSITVLICSAFLAHEETARLYIQKIRHVTADACHLLKSVIRILRLAYLRRQNPAKSAVGGPFGRSLLPASSQAERNILLYPGDVNILWPSFFSVQ